MTTTPTLWKALSQANTSDGGTSQFDGQVAASAAGHYFVVWTDNSTGNDDIVGRRYNAFGNPVGGEVRGLDAFGDGAPQNDPDIAAMAGGGLAVASVDLFAGDADIWVSIRNSTLGLVRNDAIDTGAQQTVDPAITMFANNSYAVAYTVNVGAGHSDVVGRIVSNTGVVGAQFDILNQTDATGSADLATLTNGTFVAVYQSEFFGDPADNDIFYRIFNAAGVAVTASTAVSGGNNFANETDPSVAALTAGGFVVVWTDSAGDAASTGIRGTVFNSSGAVIRADILINTVSQAGSQNEASVTALADGGFFVTWEDDSANLVRGQRFDPVGNVVGSAVVIKSGVTIGSPEVTLMSDGRIAFAIGDANSGDDDVATGIFDTRITQVDNASVTSVVGNGTADYLMHRDVAGVRNLLSFNVEDHTVLSTFVVGAVGTDWKIDGANDFDGDGDGDILMHRDLGASRTYTIERMGPGGVEAAVNIGTIGSEWFVTGTGDFNNDGDGDILIFKDVGGTRSFLVLDMQNNTVQAGIAAGTVGTDWQVDGIGDFDNDGDSDIVMHRDVGGVRNLTIFEMQNSGVVTTSSLGALGTDWQIDGVGDFDNDGDADILMRRDSGDIRSLLTLEIQDNVVVTSHIVGNIGTNTWVDGVGDFDLDGDADVALHYDTGVNRNYLTLELEDHVVVTAHIIGAIGSDWLLT